MTTRTDKLKFAATAVLMTALGGAFGLCVGWTLAEIWRALWRSIA